MKARAYAAGLVLVVALAGCASVGRQPDGAGPEARAERAMEALEREAFATARFELLALAGDCSAGRYGRDALLLLAAAELDTANPDRSPRRATHLAGAYLLLPDAEPEELPVARALYRLGVELTVPAVSPADVVPMPPVASRFDTCDPARVAVSSRALPDTPSSREGRLAALRAELVARTDSVARLRSELAATSADLAATGHELAATSDELAELQAEIERITELLKSGTPSYPRQRR